MQGNKITALGLIPVFNALTPKQNKNSSYLQKQYLTRLEIHKNEFNEEDLDFFCKFLEVNKTLIHLKLSGICNLKDKG